MVSNLWPLRIVEEKKKKERKKEDSNHTAKYNALPITMGGHNNANELQKQGHNPDGISIGSAIFTRSWQSRRSRLNLCFFRPIRIYNPNGISIDSAVFAGLSSVTDRQTDHATRSVTIGHIYVRSTGDAA